jgi:hypothetical protein
VTQRQRLTSEINEHTYGCWRVILPDFTIEQLIGIVDKNKIRFDAIFGSGLLTAQSSCTLKGYLGTFCEFVESLKKAAISPPSSGPVDVNYSSPAIDQLWDHVKGVITACNSWLKPFLDRFGIEEGNVH